jgi:hypothetical protein
MEDLQHILYTVMVFLRAGIDVLARAVPKNLGADSKDLVTLAQALIAGVVSLCTLTIGLWSGRRNLQLQIDRQFEAQLDAKRRDEIVQTIRELYLELRELSKHGERMLRFAYGELADEEYTNAQSEKEFRKRMLNDGKQQRMRVRHAQAVVRITVGRDNSLIRIAYAIRETFDAMMKPDHLSDSDAQRKRLSYIEYCIRKFEGAAQAVYGTDKLIAKLPVPDVELLSLDVVAGGLDDDTKSKARPLSSLEQDMQMSLLSAVPRAKINAMLAADSKAQASAKK